MIVIPACLAGWWITEAARENPAPSIQAKVPETLEIAMNDRFGATDGAPAGDNEADLAQEMPAEFPLVAESPAPPEMPGTQPWEPLPTVPALVEPAPAARPQANSGVRPRSPASNKTVRNDTPGAGSPNRQPGIHSPSLTPTRRLAGGRMPKPKYPAAARSRGQTGTVVVEFVVGESGRVESAHAKSPSPWPLLNEAAVRAVRGWRFPPGGVTTYTRPIIFHLN